MNLLDKQLIAEGFQKYVHVQHPGQVFISADDKLCPSGGIPFPVDGERYNC